MLQKGGGALRTDALRLCYEQLKIGFAVLLAAVSDGVAVDLVLDGGDEIKDLPHGRNCDFAAVFGYCPRSVAVVLDHSEKGHGNSEAVKKLLHRRDVTLAAVEKN